ncbi:MAG: protein kinase [Kiritimatiellae bacterium]|nr:protein kinase [Kiritimatiellia bacterium]
MSEEQLIKTPGLFGDNGNFMLERELGRGGMGGVYMGRDKMLDRPVAVKVMLKEYGSDPEFVEKFKREAQAVARLIHPNIAQVYSYGFSEGMPYIAMELVAGGSLEGLMKTKGKDIDIPRVMKICEQVAQALRCAADQGLVHGDVKPENVLLDSNGNAKLVDFGLAAMQKDTDEIWGTPFYIAPEKVKKQPVDYRADMYALGGTLYHALTGVPPFDGEDAIAVVKKRFAGPPKKPSELRPEISPQIDALVMTMLAEDPKDRFPSFEALLEEFKKVMATGLSTTSPIPAAAAPAEAKPAGTTTTRTGKKLVMKKKGFKVKTATSAAAAEDGGDVPPLEDGSAEGAEEQPKKKTDDDEEEGGSLGLKVVVVVVGVVALIGAVVGGLVWYQVAHARAEERERQAQIARGFSDAKTALKNTREKAVAFAENFETFASEAVADCQRATDQFRKILSDRYSQSVLDQLKPAPTAELLEAIASTNASAPAVEIDASQLPPGMDAATASNMVAAVSGAMTQMAEAMAGAMTQMAGEMAGAMTQAVAEGAAAAAEPAAAESAAEAPKVDADGKSTEPPAAVADINGLWEKAYQCQACAIRIGKSVKELLADIDQALTVTGDDKETMDRLVARNNELKDRYEVIKGSKDVETVQKNKGIINGRSKKLIDQTARRLREEAAQAAREAEKKAREEAERQRLAEQAAAREAKVKEEVEGAKAKFEGIAAGRTFALLDWKSAKRQLEIAKGACETPEGELAYKLEIRKVAAMESVQTVLGRNLKNYTFTKGKLKGCTVTKTTASSLYFTKKAGGKDTELSWIKFYRDQHTSFNEVLNKFIKNGRVNGNPKLNLKDWGEAMIGAALTMRLVCSDDPSAAAFGDVLIKDAVKAYPNLIKQAKEVFPDIDFGEVAAEAAAEEV